MFVSWKEFELGDFGDFVFFYIKDVVSKQQFKDAVRFCFFLFAQFLYILPAVSVFFPFACCSSLKTINSKQLWTDANHLINFPT